MIVKSAEHLAHLTKMYNPDLSRNYEQLRYQYAILLNTLAVVIPTLVVGYFDGRFTDTVAAMSAFMIFRAVSGGYHFKSLDLCAIVTVLLFVCLPFMAEYVTNPYGVLTIIISIITLWRAPTSLPEGAKNTTRHRITLKITALVVVAVGIGIGSPVITLSLFVQALTLLITRKGVNIQ